MEDNKNLPSPFKDLECFFQFCRGARFRGLLSFVRSHLWVSITHFSEFLPCYHRIDTLCIRKANRPSIGPTAVGVKRTKLSIRNQRLSKELRRQYGFDSSRNWGESRRGKGDCNCLGRGGSNRICHRTQRGGQRLSLWRHSKRNCRSRHSGWRQRCRHRAGSHGRQSCSRAVRTSEGGAWSPRHPCKQRRKVGRRSFARRFLGETAGNRRPDYCRSAFAFRGGLLWRSALDSKRSWSDR